MSDQHSADRLSKEYLYNLQNQAKESGFKPTEKWTLGLMTTKEKSLIQKNYHAVVNMKASPENLLAMLEQVQIGLKSGDPLPELKEVKQKGWEYLVAYNPERDRR